MRNFVRSCISLQANITRTNHIMFTMGTDFKYQYATSWFRQLDKFIHYVNKVFFFLLEHFLNTTNSLLYGWGFEQKSIMFENISMFYPLLANLSLFFVKYCGLKSDNCLGISCNRKGGL